MPRLLFALVCLASFAGCRATARRDANWGTLARPGDAERATVLPPRRGEVLPSPTADPLPALAPGEWRTDSPVTFRQPRAGASQRYGPSGARAGHWALGGNGDLALSLDPSSRVRVGISAGGRSLEDDGSVPGRRAFTLAPGVCFERDL